MDYSTLPRLNGLSKSSSTIVTHVRSRCPCIRTQELRDILVGWNDPSTGRFKVCQVQLRRLSKDQTLTLDLLTHIQEVCSSRTNVIKARPDHALTYRARCFLGSVFSTALMKQETTQHFSGSFKIYASFQVNFRSHTGNQT